eukprot:TRINITY_DN10782_c1_g1_i3.p6 TRINITY_DN10782_c1_g1~~TRINITY_DN10782_c1_g1_i3.p6  ORF type:complete len:110 (-),score=4.03 TRINITY_DN10782_c1_g1_i3:361-690(-)
MIFIGKLVTNFHKLIIFVYTIFAYQEYQEISTYFVISFFLQLVQFFNVGEVRTFQRAYYYEQDSFSSHVKLGMFQGGDYIFLSTMFLCMLVVYINQFEQLYGLASEGGR